MLSLVFVAVGLAQSTTDTPLPIQSQLFRPSVDAVGLRWTDDAGVVEPQLRHTARLVSHWVDRPLVIHRVYASGKQDTVKVVGGALQVNAIGGLQLKRVRVGIDVPVFLVSTSDTVPNGPGLGDIGLDARVTLLPMNDGVGLALFSRVTLPTASVAASLGAPTATGELGLVASGQVQRLGLAANIGYRVQRGQELLNVRWGNQLVYRGGAWLEVAARSSVGVELSGLFMAAQPDVESFGAGTPLELLIGVRHGLSDTVALDIAGGAGLSRGIGAARFRALVGVSWTAF